MVFTFIEGDVESSRLVSRKGNVIQDTHLWVCGKLGTFVEIQFGFIFELVVPKESNLPYDIHI